MHIVLDKPEIMLQEIQNKVLKLHNMLALSKICKFLHSEDFSRQRMHVSAIQRDEALRASFANELSVYIANMFVFLDETGASSRDVMHKYGYSWRGRLAVAQKLLVRDQRLSSVAITSTAGLFDCVTVTGAVDGDTFYEFVHK